MNWEKLLSVRKKIYVYVSVCVYIWMHTHTSTDRYNTHIYISLLFYILVNKWFSLIKLELYILATIFICLSLLHKCCGYRNTILCLTYSTWVLEIENPIFILSQFRKLYSLAIEIFRGWGDDSAVNSDWLVSAAEDLG